MVAEKSIAIGDRVRFKFGTSQAHGIVMEDRGPIGVNKARILRIAVPNDPFDDEFIEMPEDQLALFDEQADQIPNDDIVDYLRHGGLLRILRSNMLGGKNQPRVWLTRDSLGNVVHTFAPERGLIGGGTVPFLVLHDDRIFGPKRGEVVDFLRTFGLSKDDANTIVAGVGVAP